MPRREQSVGYSISLKADIVGLTCAPMRYALTYCSGGANGNVCVCVCGLMISAKNKEERRVKVEKKSCFVKKICID